MYRTPSSSRKRNKKIEKLNLIPILDAVFIFIFFLLMSANFIKIFEISSDVPIVSASPPPKSDKKPLALTLKINDSSMTLYTGVPSRPLRKFDKLADGTYDTESLHTYLIEVKKKNMHEDTVIFEPLVNIEYEKIIQLMDSVRLLRKTDESLYQKNKDGIDEKLDSLFNKIVFGNLIS